MKVNSSKIRKIVYSLIAVLTLSLLAPVNNFVMANDGTASEKELASIMDSYAGKNVNVKNGLSIDMGQELNYKDLLQPEDYSVKFDVKSSDESVVAITEEGMILGQAPGTAFVTLESSYGVDIYEVYVKMPQIALFADNIEGNPGEITPRASNGNYKVFVDPGHGGGDPGAVGVGGLREKDVNLAVGLKVLMKLKAKGIDVVMSRDTDKFLELSQISSAANTSGSDVFVSIHANSASPSASGIETYYYPGKTASGKLASNVQTNLIKSTGAKDRSAKTADFHVVRETNMPSILVETGFVTNPSEAALLKTNSYQELLAQGIVNGVEQYLKANVSLTPTLGERVYGLDRYETSNKIATLGWQSAETVIIAPGVNYPDALCAAPLATKYDAPILLAQNIALSNQGSLVNTIKGLSAKKAIIVGGTTVLSSEFENQIKGLGIQVERIGGSDRFQTSVLIAERLGNKGEVAVAYGMGYADALSISSVAAQKGIPILLTNKSQLLSPVDSYIKNNNITKTYVIGGTAVIEDSVVRQLKNPVRLAGSTRYETNKRIFDAFKDIIKKDNVYIAIGNNFPDALSISALAGKQQAFVILSNKFSPEASMIDIINGNRSEINKAYIIGGPQFITKEVLDLLNITLK